MSSRLQIKHFGKIVNGRRMYYSPSTVNSQLASFPDGTEFEEIIKKRSSKTTMSQHAYYRGVILEACYQSEMGSQFDKADDIHEDYFAPKFLSYKKLVTDPRGVKSEITKYISMAEMSIEETSEFLEKVIADCAMNGIYFRSPEEYYNSLYK